MKQKFKTACALLLGCAAALPLCAQTDEKGEAWYLDTDTQQSVLMADVDYLLAADDQTHFTVVTRQGDPIEGVTRATFAKRSTTPTGIGQAQGSGEAMLHTVVSSTLTLTGCAAGTPVRVISAQGRTLLSVRAAAGETTLNVSSLSPGCYLLQAGRRTVKFIKR